jgi:hypothetical protein
MPSLRLDPAFVAFVLGGFAFIIWVVGRVIR